MFGYGEAPVDTHTHTHTHTHTSWLILYLSLIDLYNLHSCHGVLIGLTLSLAKNNSFPSYGQIPLRELDSVMEFGLY